MLSLPENWDYSLKGLAAICKEGVDGIRSALNELEAEGYIKRNKFRKSSGQWSSEYIIYETPCHSESELLPADEKEAADIITSAEEQDTAYESSPEDADIPDKTYPKGAASDAESTTLENPTRSKSTRLDFTTWSKPTRLSQHGEAVPANPTQLNTNNKILNNNILSNQSSINMPDNRISKDEIKEQIGYNSLIIYGGYTEEQMDEIDEIVELMYDIMNTHRPVYVNSSSITSETAFSRFRKLEAKHIEYVLDSLKTVTNVTNMRSYMITMLYNAPTTASSHKYKKAR